MSDAYLERPYAVHADHEALLERFEESDQYHTALAEWATQDADVRDLFARTPNYAAEFDTWFTGGQS